MIKLSKNALKSVLGGVNDMPISSCSATCPDKTVQSRDCGTGTTCSTSGTVVSCGAETTGVDVCKDHKGAA